MYERNNVLLPYTKISPMTRVRIERILPAPGEILVQTGRLDGETLRQFAADRFAACMLGEEGREGVAAFIEKRRPRWSE